MIDQNLLRKIKTMLESANINFLIGSGTSKDYLPTLNYIEDNINQAIASNDINAQVDWYKDYLQKVMIPNKAIIDGKFDIHENYKWDKESNTWLIKSVTEAETDLNNTLQWYKRFLNSVTKTLLERKITILSKQVNIFTTNVDILIESALEELYLEYNDGFAWKLSPTYSLSNYKKSIFQRSSHFDHRSEIPVYNLVKIHGSLNWKYKDAEKTQIWLSPDLSHFDSTLMSKSDIDFIDSYKERILVVNPEDSKFAETVLNMYYYELLRLYSTELEKENSILFVIWFSMADIHIREITKRTAKSNPTLKIFIFCNSQRSKPWMESKMEIDKYPNITVLAPEYNPGETEYNYDINKVTEVVFNSIVKKDEPNE